MAWIESHDELPTHPKTAKLSRRLGVSKPQAVGHLHFLWWWCLTHRPDGWLRDMDADDVADAAGWDGDADLFLAALADVGWLDYDESVGDYFVHDWWDGAGKTIKRRKYTTERQRRKRDREQVSTDTIDSHDDVTRDTPTSNVVDSDSDSDSDIKNKTVVSRKRATNATQLPADWKPEPEPDLVKAVGGDVAARRELEKFRDYWIAQPGQKGRKKDWQATWRNWLRNSQDFKRRVASSDAPSVSKPVFGSDGWDRREREQRELESRLLDGGVA